MTLRFLTYLLLALMAVQSITAVADVHSVHQSGVEHLSFDDHEHEYGHDHSSKHSHAEFSDEPDCNHCCHCHGHSTPAILTVALMVASPNTSYSISAYLADIAPEPLANFLRPPISKA